MEQEVKRESHLRRSRENGVRKFGEIVRVRSLERKWTEKVKRK